MRIQIIAHNEEKYPEKWMRWNWIPYYFEKMGHEVDHVLKKDWKFFYLKYLKFRPDVVISANIIGFLPAFLKRIGLINAPFVHDWNDDSTDVMGRKYGIDRIAFLEHYIIKNASHITTPSKFLQKKCEIFGRKVAYIPHGVKPNFEKVEPLELEGKVKMVYVGSQGEYKMVDKLVKSVRNMNCDLYLIGKTNERLKRIATKNVHFMGFKPHKEVPRYLKAADILVITSDDDCTLKMYEYLKMNKALLALKGRIGYLLDHRVNVYLTNDFREAIKELIKNTKLRNELAKNAKKIKVHTWKEISKKYLDFLKKVVRD